MLMMIRFFMENDKNKIKRIFGDDGIKKMKDNMNAE